jgi:hypothetical protein
MNTIDRLMNVVQNDSDWAHAAIARSLQSGALYSISFASTSYIENIININELCEKDETVNPIPLNEEALAKYERVAVNKARLYNFVGRRIPEAKNIQIAQAIKDIAAGTQFGVSQQLRSKQKGEMNAIAMDIIRDELDISEDTVLKMIRQADAEDKARQDEQKIAMEKHLREVILLAEEAIRYGTSDDINPIFELAACEKVMDKLEEYKNRKMIDMLRIRSATRAAKAMGDYKILKKTIEMCDAIVTQFQEEMASMPTTNEPAVFEPNERIERFESAVNRHIAPFFADGVPVMVSKSIEDELIEAEENEEEDEVDSAERRAEWNRNIRENHDCDEGDIDEEIVDRLQKHFRGEPA